MKNILIIFIALLVGLSDGCFAQGTISRPGTKPTTTKTSKPKTQAKPKTSSKQSKTQARRTEIRVGNWDGTADGIYNEHAFIDLGLPSGTKWATCNIGASRPENVGTYFSWGDTKGKQTYKYDNTVSYTAPPAGMITNGNLAPAYDAATVNWGAPWRMPTNAELDELVRCCTWTWVENPAGVILTGPNGKTMFLPAAGYREISETKNKGESGSYWGSTIDDPSSNSNARKIYFNKGVHWACGTTRWYGSQIRPVLRY